MFGHERGNAARWQGRALLIMLVMIIGIAVLVSEFSINLIEQSQPIWWRIFPEASVTATLFFAYFRTRDSGQERFELRRGHRHTTPYRQRNSRRSVNAFRPTFVRDPHSRFGFDVATPRAT
ncbi:MAG: hypothetical protein ABI382_11615 [Nakamurella sp.]